MNTRSTTSGACRNYRNQAARLLNLPATDATRQEWQVHSQTCADCRLLIEVHAEIELHLSHLPDPEPAYVHGRVMAAVHGARQLGSLSRRNAWALGLASGMAGLALGLFLANSDLGAGATQASSSNQSYATAVSDDFDLVAVELAGNDVESSK